MFLSWMQVMPLSILPKGQSEMADRAREYPQQVKEFFDTLAVTWPSGYTNGRFTGRLARFVTALQSYVAPESHVLDLGCGTGEMACAMAATGFRVTACDISEQMLSGASSAPFSHAVEWVLLEPSWLTFPFLAKRFDAVVASSVLEYVEDPKIVLGECARVLRPAGVMVFTIPDPRQPIRRLERLASVVARSPLVRTAGQHWPSLEGYMTYLKVSTQRHPVSWWSAAAEQAGFCTIPRMPDTEGRSPLRLLGFRRCAQGMDGS
jgi:2-polyprenyl-3-methyl-5-hydroxy-6-metoxy-1,4-benzoquinol methylase